MKQKKVAVQKRQVKKGGGERKFKFWVGDIFEVLHFVEAWKRLDEHKKVPDFRLRSFTVKHVEWLDKEDAEEYKEDVDVEFTGRDITLREIRAIMKKIPTLDGFMRDSVNYADKYTG